MPEAVDYHALLRLLTVERLGSYLDVAEGDVDAAFALYEWNMDASAAVLAVSAMVEVVLRHALDARLREWAQRKGTSDWLDMVPLDERGKRDVAKARKRAQRGRGSATHGHVVAELNLGFWRFMLSRRYFTSLWVPSLRHAFPGAPQDAALARKVVESHVDQLHFLRNRAAHHEPIHRRDLTADVARAESVVGFIAPEAQRWVMNRERLRAVLGKRPL